MLSLRIFSGPTITEDYAYKMGYDCGRYGPNDINCNIRIFSNIENTIAWERGKQKAEKEIEGLAYG